MKKKVIATIGFCGLILSQSVVAMEMLIKDDSKFEIKNGLIGVLLSRAKKGENTALIGLNRSLIGHDKKTTNKVKAIMGVGQVIYQLTKAPDFVNFRYKATYPFYPIIDYKVESDGKIHMYHNIPGVEPKEECLTWAEACYRITRDGHQLLLRGIPSTELYEEWKSHGSVRKRFAEIAEDDSARKIFEDLAKGGTLKNLTKSDDGLIASYYYSWQMMDEPYLNEEFGKVYASKPDSLIFQPFVLQFFLGFANILDSQREEILALLRPSVIDKLTPVLMMNYSYRCIDRLESIGKRPNFRLNDGTRWLIAGKRKMMVEIEEENEERARNNKEKN